MSLVSAVIAAFVALAPITNPLGAVAVFSALTGDMDKKQTQRQAIKTAINVFALLAISAVAGTYVLSFLGLSIPVLQIAGGIVVGHAGFQMLTVTPRLTGSETDHAGTKRDVSFTPMALPLIAGPRRSP